MLCIPINHSDFYANFFEKQYFHLPGVGASGLFSWADLDDLLFRLEPEKQGDIKVMLEGKVSANDYSTCYQDLNDIRQKIVPQRLEALLRSGATVVMNRLDVKSRKIALICQEISDQYNLKTVANGYLALGGTGAFGKHWDTHDVFALQVFGRKRWRVFMPTFSLPLEHQTSQNVKDTCPDIAVFDRILNAGELLYIPRGWWHEAMPLGNEPTFHLAIGAHTSKLLDYVIWVASQLLPTQQLARTSVIDPSLSEVPLSKFSTLVADTLSDSENYSKFCSQVQRMRNSFVPFNFESIIKSVNR